ncbi:uncharacterized protein [Halyomorpha halys]|uniref:uncharacterized protein n=1 Tax=Halyomorpha halys TaxID=286706 RepID=UPI0006D5053F|nr:uncharacterized protein LOC106687292 [Halyomorpha halys]KAE8573331.1 EcKinase 6 [Halyomorpha halys]
MALQIQDVHEVVRSHIKSDDFEIISCEGVDLGGITAGFQSNANKAQIRFKTTRGEGKLDLFIKNIPELPYHRKTVLEMDSFNRESILFNEVLNKYHDYLKDHTIPECYLARSDIQIMEDMTKKGFKNRPIYETFDLQHCEKTMATLAKFHALSFITEKREGRKMTEIVPIIKTETVMSTDKNHIGRRLVEVTIKSLKRVAKDYLEQLPSEAVKKAFDYLDHSFEEMRSSKLYPNVLSHGDMWASNIMFSYDDQGNVAEACIYDFQLAAYKAPGYDIQLFFHCCTNNELRERYKDHLLRLYYVDLTRILRSEGIEIEDLMCWEDFENMLEETLPITLAQATLFLTFVLTPESIVKDVMSCDEKCEVYFEVDRTDYVLESLANHENYKRRVIPTLTNFINYFTKEL